MVGIEAAQMWADHLVVPNQELHVKLWRQLDRVHELVVPEAGPALVHDLGINLGQEVAGLLIDDGEDIPLPGSEVLVVVTNKQKDVLIGLQREA